ncbi:MAG: oligoendopeptidase F [Planctomycetia bacterium]|nr:oligoendopeptidase F [Planctomycetia bacterium]
MATAKQLPKRSDVDPADCWNLDSLFKNDQAWERAFGKWEKLIPRYDEFRGKLDVNAEKLAELLKFDAEFERAGERLGTYAFLKTAEDAGDSNYQRMQGRLRHASSLAAQRASYIRPEIMAIPPAKMKRYLAEECLTEYRLQLERILRYKPHTLSDSEENLLAMQTEMSDAAGRIFRQLNDVDLKFGRIKNERGGTIELSHATFSTCLHSPDRKIRKAAFHQYYEAYSSHANTLAASYAGAVQRDAYYAKARRHASSLDAALFPDRVPRSVYDNLISSVRAHLPSLYRYYELRRRRMKLKEIHHYDTYVPILSELERRHSWQQAVDVVIASLAPLGSEYGRVLERGLNDGWCDRYENQGKQSGAFSCGSFDGQPYILMNYQEAVLNHVFTLAHEAGHSMHSYFSAKSQPFQYYDYTIFVAEVASTFNEQLLLKHLLAKANDRRERAYLINKAIDDIRGTIFRQTMFAEFEKITHELVEAGEPLTVARLRSAYRELLTAYFGPEFVIDECLDLECLRIPHFYRAFYVYKYATGLSAAIALAERVTTGGKAELQAYLGFLKGGCSKYPLDLLRDAGVDMEQPGPVDTALSSFGALVDELDTLL